jgi:hypothetical protein
MYLPAKLEKSNLIKNIILSNTQTSQGFRGRNVLPSNKVEFSNGRDGAAPENFSYDLVNP